MWIELVWIELVWIEVAERQHLHLVVNNRDNLAKLLSLDPRFRQLAHQGTINECMCELGDPSSRRVVLLDYFTAFAVARSSCRFAMAEIPELSFFHFVFYSSLPKQNLPPFHRRPPSHPRTGVQAHRQASHSEGEMRPGDETPVSASLHPPSQRSLQLSCGCFITRPHFAAHRMDCCPCSRFSCPAHSGGS